MELYYKDEAIKKLKRIPTSDRIKALKKIDALKTNPLLGKPLRGMLFGLRSLRAWPLRIIYTYQTDKHRIIIETVDYRGSVYK